MSAPITFQHVPSAIAAPAGEWTAGASVLGDFAVERALGRGGMGAVYLLRSRSTGRAFAVKRALVRDAAARRALMGELQTWIDLPAHPHLLPCRFFRTLGDEVIVFTDYADGGSLADAIADGRLAALPAILDAAIQLAWGLHAAHAAGLVHQDVKPANALVERDDGAVRVADFGLARARAAAGGVARAGMTAAYCSPEQAAGLLLTHRTDVYSWAVAVLEMFTGELGWLDGQAAPLVLERWIKRGPRPGRPAVPPAVAAVLRAALARDPDKRPATLAAAADALIAAHAALCERPYARPAPDLQRLAPAPRAALTRALATGATWRPAALWVATALEAAGRDAAEARALLAGADTAGSTRAQVVADLAGYDAAAGILSELIARGRLDVVPTLATLSFERAAICRFAGDLAGAIAAYDQALDAFTALPGVPMAVAAGLIAAKAAALRVARRFDEATALLTQTAAMIEARMASGEPTTLSLAYEYGAALLSLAIAHTEQGAPREAVAAADRAAAVFERALARRDAEPARTGPDADATEYDADGAIVPPVDLLACALAAACETRGVALRRLGETPAALAAFDRTIALRERVVAAGRTDVSDGVAAALRNKGMALREAGDARGAAALHARALDVYDALVEQQGRHDLEEELAGALANLAYARAALGEYDAAFALYDRALARLERLVVEQGRDELANELARVQLNCAVARGEAGELAAARALYDRVIATRERLVAAGQRGVRRELALAYTNQGNVLSDLGEHAAALALHDRAVALRALLVDDEGHDELRGDLATAHMNRAEARRGAGDAAGALDDLERGAALLDPPPPGVGARAARMQRARAYAARGGVRGEVLDAPGEAAREFERAIALYDEVASSAEPDGDADRAAADAAVIELLLSQARALALDGRRAEGVPLYERAIARAEARAAAAAPGSLEEARAQRLRGAAHGNQGSALAAVGVPAAARAHYETARDAYRRALGAASARGDVGTAAELRAELAPVLRQRAWLCATLGDAPATLAALRDAVDDLRGDDGDDAAASLEDVRAAALACTQAASALGPRGDHAPVEAICTLGIALWERVVAAGEPEGGAACEGDLAAARVLRAVARFNLGERAGGEADARAALAALEREAPRTGREDLAQLLAWAQGVFGPLLAAQPVS